MELMEEGMKLTKDIMKATGETIAVCEQLDVDPRLVARVLLGVVEWADREPKLAPDKEPVAMPPAFGAYLDWLKEGNKPDAEEHECGAMVHDFECVACDVADAMVAGKQARRCKEDGELKPTLTLEPKAADGERDAKGRKVVKRDHNWRENTLQRMQVGESALMSYLLEQLPGVTRGAMAQRMAMLVAEGHLEQIGPGSWRRVK